jgi:hypothetical protein
MPTGWEFEEVTTMMTIAIVFTCVLLVGLLLTKADTKMETTTGTGGGTGTGGTGTGTGGTGADGAGTGTGGTGGTGSGGTDTGTGGTGGGTQTSGSSAVTGTAMLNDNPAEDVEPIWWYLNREQAASMTLEEYGSLVS